MCIISLSSSWDGSSIACVCFSQAKCFTREHFYSGGARLSVWLFIAVFISFVFCSLQLWYLLCSEYRRCWWNTVNLVTIYWWQSLMSQSITRSRHFVSKQLWSAQWGSDRIHLQVNHGQQWLITLWYLADKLSTHFVDLVTCYQVSLCSYSSKTCLSNNFSRETGKWMRF